MPDQDHQVQFDSGLYRDDDGKLLIIDKHGKYVKLDFDVDKLNLKKNEESTIKNNIENESDMDLEKTSQADMTKEQLEENYWVETSKTKIDGSTAMMEKRISGCMEVTGKSREECSREVKARMKKKGSDNINTTDTSDVKDEENEEDEEDEDEEEDKKDTIEICSKEFDMLKAKAERLDTLEAEKEELQYKLDTIESKVNTIFEERAKEVENRRLETIKKFSTDFDVPEEKLKDKSIERLEEDMDLINMIVKKNVVEEEPIAIDFDDSETDFGKRVKALDNAYKIKVVK